MPDLQYASQNNVYDAKLRRFAGVKSGFAATQIDSLETLGFLFDFCSILKERGFFRFDSDASLFTTRLPLDYVIQPTRNIATSSRFASCNDSCFSSQTWRWNEITTKFALASNDFDAARRLFQFFCANKFDGRKKYDGIAAAQFGADVERGGSRQNGIASLYDVCLAYRERCSNRFERNVGAYLFAEIPNDYDKFVYQPAQIPIRWNAIPCEFRAKELSRFDAEKGAWASYPTHFQTLVPAGWRIFAKNRATGTTQELGFIDATAEERSLSGIFLPDGDYEVFVLTSSYFWKDAKDRSFLAFSLKPGEELSPLPQVYNLRSTINGGVTSIFWSAQTSDVSDCVFGLWYSTQTPVPTNAAPDATVWYSPDMTEYQTSLTQVEPQYVAVAPMRTGNTSEIGPVAELYLDWKNAPPNAPENVVPLNNPISIADENGSNTTENVFNDVIFR